jgi:uncharacterized OB-fold protein
MTRPAPVVTDDSRDFWEAARDGRLVAQRCSGCGQLRHPPRPMCPHCHSIVYEQAELVGTGSIYSYAILHHPQHAAFTYPVIAVLVDLDEGVRVLSNLVGVAPDAIEIGSRVRVTFEATAEGMAVPVFEPAESGGA